MSRKVKNPLHESRQGSLRGPRFPGENGPGESQMGIDQSNPDDRCYKQDRQFPAKIRGKRKSQAYSRVYQGKRMMGVRKNSNQYCYPGLCGEDYEGKSGGKYYEYRRNRADKNPSKRERKQTQNKVRKYKTRKVATKKSKK